MSRLGQHSQSMIPSKLSGVESCDQSCDCRDCYREKRYSNYPPDRRIVGKLIGGGTFGRVYTHARHQQLAVKYVILEDDMETSLIECAIMRSLDHPGLVRATEIKRDDNGLYIIMPRAAYDLKHYIQRNTDITEETKLRWLAQILSGLRFLHSLKLIHADIKPNNILLYPRLGEVQPFKPEDLDAKICDYGKTRYHKSRSHTKSVPHKVAPPEYLDDLKLWTFSETAFGIDIWALACSWYHIHQHDYLYPDERVTAAVIKSAIAKLPSQSKLDNILKRMLTYNANQRPSAAMLLGSLELQAHDTDAQGKLHSIDQHPLQKSEYENIHSITWEDQQEVIPYKWIEIVAGRIKWAVAITETTAEWEQILQWSVMLVFEMHFDIRCYPENFRTLDKPTQIKLFTLLDALDYRILKS